MTVFHMVRRKAPLCIILKIKTIWPKSLQSHYPEVYCVASNELYSSRWILSATQTVLEDFQLECHFDSIRVRQ